MVLVWCIPVNYALTHILVTKFFGFCYLVSKSPHVTLDKWLLNNLEIYLNWTMKVKKAKII